jgi:tetratricopeptide (TPR) repeat protein
MAFHARKSAYRAIVVFAILAAAGCTSVNDSYLIQSLDDEAKAKALTTAGIEEYSLRLVNKAEYDRIAEIRRYFEVALSFDPENVQAAQYLDMVDEFKTTKVRQKLKEANKYLGKQKRKEDEDFALLVAVQTAASLDPANKDVAKLVKDTAPVRTTLAGSYVTRSKAAVAQVSTATTVVAREALYVEAFQYASRAVAVDPQNGPAKGTRDSLREELAKGFTRRAAAAKALISAKKFEEARAEVAGLADLNRKLDGVFDADVKAATYSLNYQWASVLFAQKEYPKADARVTAALSVARTPEAAALKRRIAQMRNQAVTEASFDAGLAEIDRLITKQEIVGAKRRIDILVRVTRDPDKLDSLDERRDKLRTFLKDFYDRGVAAYRDEKFKDAIDALQVVVIIDVGYEQASDYLDKAKAKQKLLDQY